MIQNNKNTTTIIITTTIQWHNCYDNADVMDGIIIVLLLFLRVLSIISFMDDTFFYKEIITTIKSNRYYIHTEHFHIDSLICMSYYMCICM